MATTCSMCKRAFPQTELFDTPDGVLCTECGGEPPGRLMSPLVIAALVLGAVPFFFHITSSSSVTVNGEITQSVYRDYVAIIAGIAAGALGLGAVAVAFKADARRGARIAIAAGIVGLGLLQVTRGFGM